MADLKPCPFCGGTDVNLRHHLATNMSWVSCGECGLEAPSETGWTDDIAIEYWNTRNDAEIKELRAKLFPYADATEISGISWDGKYLIGDKASIRFFHEMKNRGEQIDVYKRTYDQNLAAKDAEIAALKAKMDPLVGLLTGLVAESGRDVGWGEEDSFRMGEWFEAHDLAAIEAARAALKEKADA